MTSPPFSTESSFATAPVLDAEDGLPPRELQLLVFSDDWGRHPSSCQHLVSQLLSKYQVTWVNTIGTRRPALDWYTLGRAAQKLREWLFEKRSADPPPEFGPRVFRPLMWPSFRSRAGRWLNRKLLGRAVTTALDPARRTVGLTTLPVTADLIGLRGVDRWVYYCVDDLSEWPGLDKSSLETMERELVARVDAILAVSDNLVARMRSMGRSAVLLTHGVDLEHWRSGRDDQSEIREWDEPRIVFWGVIDRRLNVDWLARLSQRMTKGTIVLLGPENNPDPRLRKLPRVTIPGPMPYRSLPSIAQDASVLIMPYDDLPATRAMQPLKLKEYLATGRPVVSADLPAVREWRFACDVATSADDFAEKTLARSGAALPSEQVQARARLQGESWAAKADLLEKTLLGMDAVP